MKKYFKVFCIWLHVLLLAGCVTMMAPVQKKPFIDQAIWPKTTKDKVYTACLTALQMQGISIHPLATSKESGLIIIEEKDFDLEGCPWELGYYKFQILVSELQDNKIMVDVNVTASWKERYTDRWGNPGYTKDDVNNTLNNRVAEDLKKFFTQLDILMGKAEYYRSDKILHW